MIKQHFFQKILPAVIRVLVSSILLFAAFSKIQIAPAILRGDSLLSNPILLYGAICVESGVAIWALTAPARLVWFAITILFVVLTAFASFAIFSNRECNCFGDLLPSGSTLPINIAIVISMLATRNGWGFGRESKGNLDDTKGPAVVRSQHRWAMNLFVAFLASLAGATATGFALNRALTTQKEMPNIRFLLADDWVGKSWPIDHLMDPSLVEIEKGKWLALIFRSDCEHCKALAQRIEDQRSIAPISEPQIVSFVAGDSVWPVHFGKASTDSKSSSRIHWSGGEEPFVASPAAFFIDNGKVIEAKDGEKADQFVERILHLPEK